MTFLEFAETNRPAVETRLLSFLKNQAILSNVSPWGEDVKKRYIDFATKGKLLRGCLVLLGYEMFGREKHDDTIITAAALELFHSSLLIHDDIMDQDRMRRGNPTFFAQYEDLAKQKHLRDTNRTGKSLAMCAGDIGFFLSFSLIDTLSPESRKQIILQTITDELMLVGLGQMQDVALGAKTDLPTEKEILSVYRYKTARYTFSLPLVLGALLAGAGETTMATLIKLGEAVGTIYQIKDDELNLFGDEKQTGKPVGSDIREGKKTLYYYLLGRNQAGKKLLPYFGDQNLSSEHIDQIRNVILEEKIQALLDKRVDELSHTYHSLLKTLPVSGEYKGLLSNLLEYCLKRSS